MRTVELMDYERAHVVDALRRDMQRESEAAHTDPAWREDHLRNARKSQDLLEMLNPKRQHWH